MSVLDGPITVDIFKDNIYTWKGVLIGPGSISQNFPPGVYTVHLRCSSQVNPFLGPICISYTGNVNSNYSLAPISGYSFVTQADSYTGGQVNYFTCHTSSGADPIMYLENGLGATVGSTNNNYSGTGDFNWTVNARIKTSYSGAPLVHIFNASANIPEGTCDLYVRIPFHSNTTQDIYDYFNLTWNSLIGLCPSIKADDTMLSGALNSTYNCIGWSGDLLDYVWPTQSSSAYYYPGVAEIVAFDLYYEDRGYTIVGATAANAGVALWLTNTGYVTHASITNNSRSIYPHGFDWESKLGAYSPRVFHEKDALVGDAYGTIQRYYRPDPDAPAMVTTTENATFSLNARNLLQDMQNSRNTEELNRLFSNLYDAWSDYCHSPEVMIQSNPETLKSDDSYRELMSLCHKEPNSHLLVVDKLIKGDFKAGFLLDDIIPSEYAYLKRDAYHHYQKGMKEIPTMLANFYRLAEAYLNEINK